MDTALFLGFAAAYSVLLLWGFALAARTRWWTPANLPLLVVAALVYDNLVLGSGRWIGEGALLEAVNYARFYVHAAITPLLVAWALHTLRRAGFAWAQARWYQVASIGAALALTFVEFLLEVRGLKLAPREEFGVLSYTGTEPPSGPPLMVLIVAAVLLVAGALLWKRRGWPWLFAGALVMTIGSGVRLPIDSGAVTNAFELTLLISIIATKAYQDGDDRSVDNRPAASRITTFRR